MASRACKISPSVKTYPRHFRAAVLSPRRGLYFRCRAGELTKEGQITGIVFQPWQEMQPNLRYIDEVLDKGRNDISLARVNYEDRLEAAVNEQINIEYNMSYIYHSLSAFFDRDNVGLPGFAAYFKHQSDEEREHADLLVRQQNRRGGKVRLQSILGPESEFFHDAKGDALYATEITLSLEKLNFHKLRELHRTATECDDPEMTHFIEDYLLHNQAKEVKEVATLVSQLRRVGQGHGVYHIDTRLYEEYGEDNVDGGPAN